MLTLRILLLGRDREQSLQAIAVGLAGLIAMVAFWNVGRLSEMVYDLLPVDVIGAIAVLLIVLAGIHAFVNDGLLVNWASASLVVLGGTVSGVGVGLQTPTLLDRVGFSLALAVLAGVTLGTVGFVLGAGLRQVVSASQ